MHIHWLNELKMHLNNYFLEGHAASQSSWELFPFSNFLSQPCRAPGAERELMALNHQLQVASHPWGCVPSTDGEQSEYFPLLPYLRKAVPDPSEDPGFIHSEFIAI